MKPGYVHFQIMGLFHSFHYCVCYWFALDKWSYGVANQKRASPWNDEGRFQLKILNCNFICKCHQTMLSSFYASKQELNKHLKKILNYIGENGENHSHLGTCLQFTLEIELSFSSMCLIK